MFVIKNESDKTTVEKDGKNISPMLITEDYVTVETTMSHLRNLKHDTYPDTLALAIPIKGDKHCRWINIIKSDIGYNVDFLVRFDTPQNSMFDINYDNTIQFLERKLELNGITVYELQPDVMNAIRIFTFSKEIHKIRNLEKEIEFFVVECEFAQKECSDALGKCGVSWN